MKSRSISIFFITLCIFVVCIAGVAIAAVDVDLDGVANAADNCPLDANVAQVDTDSDDIGDACDGVNDIDVDEDGILNASDTCPFQYDAGLPDDDSDGLAAACDPDDNSSNTDEDADTILNANDNCPFVANLAQTDTDGDGIGDVCDATDSADADGDGVINGTDNCALVSNPDQEDTDADGIGDACYTPFSGAGTGVEGDPYIITSCTELMEVNNFLDAYFQLDGGISDGILDCTANANDIMIGSAGDPFTGNFDGNSIKVNIDIEAVDDYAGLFRYVSGASIANLGAGGTVIGTSYVGGIIGYGENPEIDSSYSQVNVTGTSEYIGGFVGYIEGSTITDSYATGLITGGSENIGGFAGEIDGASTVSGSYAIGNVSSSDPEAIDMGGFAGDIDNSIVTASYATGSVSGESYIGGFVGDSDTNAEFYQSYATGTVTGTGENIGGFIGDIENGLIQNSYSLGTVVGADDTGGFVGDAADSTIIHSYSAGAVSGSGEVGGFLGEDEINNTFTMSFFDTETSGFDNACGNTACSGIVGETTENMKNVYTFNPYSEDGYGFPLEETALYRYVKWEITTIRDGGDTDCYTGDVCTQASEFSLMLDGFDLVFDGITVTNPDGVNPPGSEAGQLIDSDTGTKFLDAAFSSGGSSLGSTSVIFDAGVGESFEFNGYDWATGNDMTTRDAISWTVSGSDDDVSYTVLDTQTIYSTTTDRQTFVVGTENENWDFYTIWAITADDNDGYPFLQQLLDSPYEYEAGIAPYVITEVTPIPETTTDTSPIYTFAIEGEGEAELLIEGSCGDDILAEALGSDPLGQDVQFNNLEVGETYECTITVRSDSGDSNVLTVGPFTVLSSGGGSSSSSTAADRARAQEIWQEYYASSTNTELPLGAGACSIEQQVTQNLKQGARDGSYHPYAKATAKDVALVQKHINRILALYFDQAAGPVDGIFGPLTKQGVQRLQQTLQDKLGLDLGPAGADGIVGPFTRAAINGSCPETTE